MINVLGLHSAALKEEDFVYTTCKKSLERPRGTKSPDGTDLGYSRLGQRVIQILSVRPRPWPKKVPAHANMQQAQRPTLHKYVWRLRVTSSERRNQVSLSP